jgi:acetoin utilization protein AcuB
MLVKHRMTPNPLTVTTDTSLKDALELLRSKPFRHLPVMDEDGKLVGIVTEKSLVYASPTSTTTLSVFEVDYILSHTTMKQIIGNPVITVEPDLPIEEAARIMLDHHIGCLPVVEDDELVGIISDTDIFRVFVEGLGIFWGEKPEDRVVTLRLEGVDREAAVQALENAGIQVVTVWEPPKE